MDARFVAPPLAGQVLAADECVLAEWRDAGGPSGPQRLIAPLHVHYRDDEAWYVLHGRLRVQVEAQEVEVAAGADVVVPNGTTHMYWQLESDPTPVRYLLLMTPRPHQIVEALHDRSPEALGAVFRCYKSDLLTPWRPLRLAEQGVPPQLRSSARLCVQSLHRTATSAAAATLSWGRRTGVAMAAFCLAGATALP